MLILYFEKSENIIFNLQDLFAILFVVHIVLTNTHNEKASEL
jgi:hypothetical protein